MRKTIDKILEWLLIVVISIMLLSVIWQVASRYLVGSPSTFTDEIASYSLIWLGLFGAAYATGKELHLAIDLIPNRIITKAPKFFAAIITFGVVIFGLLVMVIGGARLCWLTLVLDQKSAVLQIPLAYVYLVIPLSGLLIIYYSLDSFIKKSRILKKRDGLYGGINTHN